MKNTVLIFFAFVLFVFLSGCQQNIKKPEQKEEAIKSETSVSAEAPGGETMGETAIYGEEIPSGEGRTTPDEFKKAVETGEVVQDPIPEDVDFVSPDKVSPEAQALFANVYFDFDSYAVTSGYQEKLKKIAAYLSGRPQMRVLIEGNCDERGTREYNLVLGEQRALSVRKFLVVLGVSPKRLFTVSYGLAKPADVGHSDDAWRKNRRCEFRIAGE